MSNNAIRAIIDRSKDPKTRRQVIALAVAAIVLFTWWRMPGKERARPAPRQKQEAPPPTLGTRDAAVVQMINETSKKLQTIESAMQGKDRIIEAQNNRIKTLEAAQKTAREGRGSRNGNRGDSVTPEQIQQIVEETVQGQLQMYEQAQQAQAVAYAQPQAMPQVQVVSPPIPPTPHKVVEAPMREVTIPAGTVFPVDSYSGVAKLADDGRKVHSVVRIGRITRSNGPNKSTIPLAGCRIVIMAELQTADEVLGRIPFQGETLSCVMPDGITVSEEIDGYITDQSDTPGFRAAVYSQHFEHFKEIAKAVGPSVISDLIKAGKDTTTQTSVFGTVTETGSSATADIAADVGRLYLRSAEAYIRPIMLAKSNDKGYFWVRKPLVLKGVTPQMLQAKEASRATYR